MPPAQKSVPALRYPTAPRVHSTSTPRYMHNPCPILTLRYPAAPTAHTCACTTLGAGPGESIRIVCCRLTLELPGALGVSYLDPQDSSRLLPAQAPPMSMSTYTHTLRTLSNRSTSSTPLHTHNPSSVPTVSYHMAPAMHSIPSTPLCIHNLYIHRAILQHLQYASAPLPRWVWSLSAFCVAASHPSSGWQ